MAIITKSAEQMRAIAMERKEALEAEKDAHIRVFITLDVNSNIEKAANKGKFNCGIDIKKLCEEVERSFTEVACVIKDALEAKGYIVRLSSTKITVDWS